MTSIYAENHQKKVKILQKIGSKHLNTDKKVFPGRLFRAGRLLDLHKFPPRTFIKDRTSIRETRVFMQNKTIYLNTSTLR